MPNALITTSGRIAKAIRMFNESELFIGIAVADAWTSETSPPSPDQTAMAMGYFSGQTYTGATMSSANTTVAFNQTSFTQGSISYKVTALSSNTYDVRKVSDNSLVGASSYTSSATARTTIVPGLSFLVTSTSMTAGHKFEFKVDGPIGYKKVEEKYLVIPDSTGTILYRGQNYLIVNPSEAYDKGARYVYVKAVLRYDELPLVDYRQVGLISGLDRATGVSGSVEALLPNQVDFSTLEVIDNRTYIQREIDTTETITFIVEH